MQSVTSPDHSASDDALASGGPAGDGGFNWKKPFTTRDGRLVSGIAGVLPPALSITGVVSGEKMSWDRETGQSRISRNLDLVNIDVDPLAVRPTPAGDMAGEDDAAITRFESACSEGIGGLTGFNAAQWIDVQTTFRLAREGARREPVAGNGWQSIETAPKDGTRILLWASLWDMSWGVQIGYFAEGVWYTPEGAVEENEVGFDLEAEVGDDFDPDDQENCGPTHWRSLPAAPGTDTNATTPATAPVTPLEEAMCRTFMRLEGRAAYADRTGDFYDCGLDKSLPAWRAKLWWVQQFLAAHPGLRARRVGSGDRQGRIATMIRDRVVDDQFRVEYIDEDGGCEVAIFHGPDALDRAICFAGGDYYDGWNDPQNWGENGVPAPPCAAIPDGAGSGSEPVAWQWRSKAGPSGWGRHCPMGYDKPDSAPGYEDRPLYAVPPASVDAVAVKGLLEEKLSKFRALDKQSRRLDTSEYMRGQATGRCDAIHEALAALRARQPVEAPERDALDIVDPRAYDAAPVVAEGLHIVFDGPPGPAGGRFVEVETPEGRGFNAGQWIERPDGLWALVIPSDVVLREAMAKLAMLQPDPVELCDAYDSDAFANGVAAAERDVGEAARAALRARQQATEARSCKAVFRAMRP